MYPILAFLMLAAVSAEPLRLKHAPGAALESRSMPGPSGKLLDSFSQSDMEYGDWVDQTVKEGHLHRPYTNTTGIMVFGRDGESWSVKLKNVACSTVTGSKELLGKAESHFCDTFVKKAGEILAKDMEVDVTRLMCDNGIFCRLGLRTVFDFFGLYQNADDVVNICHDMFGSIYSACPDGGGTAEAEVTTSTGEVMTGHLESSYSLSNDNGCTPGLTQECFDQTIP